MKLPKKIKVGNITYRIIKDAKAQADLKMMNTVGYHSGTEQTLAIANKLTPEMTRNTFFHELTHALMYQIGAVEQYENELFIQSLANELDKLFELKDGKR